MKFTCFICLCLCLCLYVSYWCMDIMNENIWFSSAYPGTGSEYFREESEPYVVSRLVRNSDNSLASKPSASVIW